ncbi:GAF domain-containing sensor histidine kinase [Actinomycetospora sp. TBRC 11914]|uniref:GAF domain-containing sensor histidine kinase n=1 Tax=Actinomycetospora sp. TBRC 11914 TaxID=2729387 RepID=UPI00145E24CE|nr:GAF domain-containing sensor histidine kinase [Actinomycetospora sp. TBRC 11914]NMO88972.1 GAF domain-containing sensor histidine kinase [Actinomycetospora sp. TBRC 11914]
MSGLGLRGLGLDDPERENAVLLAIIEATASGPDPEARAAAVARVITEATATDVCFVHVLDDSERALTLLGATPPFDAEVGAVHLPLGRGVSGWVASHREPVVIVEDKESDPRYVPIPALRGQDYTSMVSVPMISAPDGLAGVLNVHTRARRRFDDRDVRLLLAIGRLLAGAVHQARMHRRLAVRERAHERFAEQTVAAGEAERRRLARDIHDGISQRLVSLSYHLDAALTHLGRADPAAAHTAIDAACELVDTALGETRAAIGALRPPVLDDLGLAGALAALARDLPGVTASLALTDARFPDHLEIALYRIAQEALQNVGKHAAAERVTVRLDADGHGTRLTVTDDGVGFTPGAADPVPDPDDGGYGLASMRERAELIGGAVRVTSRPGGGTSVVVTVPDLQVQPNGEGFAANP